MRRDGSTYGRWYCAALAEQNAENFRPYSSLLSIQLEIYSRLKNLRGHGLLLQPSDSSLDENLCLLVRAIGCEALEDGQLAIKCQHIGTVVALNQSKNHQTWRWVNITLGADTRDNCIWAAWVDMSITRFGIASTPLCPSRLLIPPEPPMRSQRPSIDASLGPPPKFSAQNAVYWCLKEEFDVAWETVRQCRTQEQRLPLRLFWRFHYWFYGWSFQWLQDQPDDDFDSDDFDLFAEDPLPWTYKDTLRYSLLFLVYICFIAFDPDSRLQIVKHIMVRTP